MIEMTTKELDKGKSGFLHGRGTGVNGQLNQYIRMFPRKKHAPFFGRRQGLAFLFFFFRNVTRRTIARPVRRGVSLPVSPNLLPPKAILP